MRALLFLAAFASTAHAQTVSSDALPLDVGNRWEYLADGRTLTWEVTGERVVDGERLAELTLDGTATCLVQSAAVSDGVRFQLRDPADPGLRCPADAFPGAHPTASAAGLTVAGMPVTAFVAVGDTTVTASTWSGAAYGSGLVYSNDFWTVAQGIGVTSFRRTSGGAGVPQTPAFVYTLAYARIRGISYGQPVIPAGEGPFERYLPLAVGNRWEYSLTETLADETTISAGVVALEVTTVAAPSQVRAAAQVRIVRRDAAGAVTQFDAVLNADGFATRSQFSLDLRSNAEDDRLFPSAFALSTETGLGPVAIGGETVTAERSRAAAQTQTTLPNSALLVTRIVDAAAGIGVTSWTFDQTTYSMTPSRTRTSGRLEYARVDGVEYGLRIVAGEPLAPSAAARLTAGPNPATTATTLRFEPTVTEARIVLVDALGREVRRVLVAAGAAEARIETASLAPGVYVARLGEGDASQSVRLVVAR